MSVDTGRGLGDDDIRRLRNEHGPNKITPPPSGLLGKLAGYFFGGFGSILIVAGILVFISWKPLGTPPAPANLALACVLIAVWLIQAAFNAWQDWSTSKVMAHTGTMLPDQCIGIRGGSHTRISAQDLVPGDIVVIKQGNKLPADVRFVEVSGDAMFDRSILTGKDFWSIIIAKTNRFQANLSQSTLPSTKLRRTILRPTTSVCKEHIVFPAAVLVSAWPPATTPSSDALQSLPQIPRLA